MNAKKIMGAVLVALLAAALFVGAGAAVNYGPAFVYQTESDLPDGVWTSGSASVTVNDDGNITAASNFVPGTYKLGSDTAYISYPTATITGIANPTNLATAYNFIGATLYKGDTVDVNATAAVDPAKVLLTFPDGSTLVYDQGEAFDEIVTALPKGTYKLAVNFSVDDFVPGTLVDLLVSEPVSFTVADADDATIAASNTDMIKGENFQITVTGKPGQQYSVQYEKIFAFNVSANQLGNIAVGDQYVNFTMPNTGKLSFTIAGNTTVSGNEQKVTLMYNKDNANPANWKSTGEKLTINFKKGVISAKTDAAAYFVGNTVKVIGSTTAGDITVMTLEGTNFVNDSVKVVENDFNYGADAVKTFEFEINTKTVENDKVGFDGKKLDVGTYTLTINTTSGVKATVPVVLKQPFISIVEAPEVIVQGDDAEFIINAEATANVAYYIFGTNYFKYAGPVDSHTEDEDGKPILNQFLIKLEGDEVTDKMAAGQYFAVFQHPMYDGALNIVGNNDWQIKLMPANTLLFDVKNRQTANAAQALCDALDTQNIDDMYVKYSFFVVGEDQSFTMSEIPTEVVKGDKIVISGVSTANAEETVTVEMISTAFAAVPKETVGSAAFILVTTEIAEDGTWEVTLDTSDLNVDEYSLKVAVSNADKPWKNVNINVVEGADKPDTPDTPDVPDTPDTPDTPTEPETPGFGALAALAGLGAVAVLLLRRE